MQPIGEHVGGYKTCWIHYSPASIQQKNPLVCKILAKSFSYTNITQFSLIPQPEPHGLGCGCQTLQHQSFYN